MQYSNFTSYMPHSRIKNASSSSSSLPVLLPSHRRPMAVHFEGQTNPQCTTHQQQEHTYGAPRRGRVSDATLNKALRRLEAEREHLTSRLVELGAQQGAPATCSFARRLPYRSQVTMRGAHSPQ